MQTSRVAGRCLNGQDCGLLCITQMLHLGECVDGDGDKGQPQLSHPRTFVPESRRRRRPRITTGRQVSQGAQASSEEYSSRSVHIKSTSWQIIERRSAWSAQTRLESLLAVG